MQHAREIADAGVATQDDVRGLYERIGRPVPGYHDAYETSEAAATGVRIWRELLAAFSAWAPASRRPEDR